MYHEGPVFTDFADEQPTRSGLYLVSDGKVIRMLNAVPAGVGGAALQWFHQSDLTLPADMSQAIAWARIEFD